MTLPEPMSWNRAEARKERFDGKFIIGVMTTGIYCLPSCAARPPKPENVRIFPTEAQAKAAGLRACKRCRPDLYYCGENENLALFEGLRRRVLARPETFGGASKLAQQAGISLTKLGELFRDHAHQSAMAWLRGIRVQHAAQDLLKRKSNVAEIGFDAGFESESVFHRQFLSQMCMTPGAYRALDSVDQFLLNLPVGYRAEEILAYHARDPLSISEKSQGNRIWKALHTSQAPVVIEISIEPGQAWVKVHTDSKLAGGTMAELHAAALRMLGLNLEVRHFETRHPTLTAPRRGLRLPLLPTGFDALCWGILGQDISVKFASRLRRVIVELAGERIGDMCAHPKPDRVANIDLGILRARGFSRAKAEHLSNAARAVAEGKLAIENLRAGSAIAAEKALTGLPGIGIWTARYVMLRCGFADAVLIGDSTLATALQRLQKLPNCPDAEEAARLMSQYAPYRSIATMHLWTYMREAA